MNRNMEKVEKALKMIKSKAATDAEFRTLCLNNPEEAVEQATASRCRKVSSYAW
ncbi:hypothetical protein [Aneurinibacillus migulanus]|uniref:Nif11 domain-containing protein n=1 Tax=Aneurinibacillus migulanus TaxID=47500 RepID=A0A1G8SY85_ANEMI|nr:hypothetical protein [Aneurinibacillus migulanus]MED0894472.1 hypothetical protein [Aneurinibacillus migulanus]MED1617082.1 hypothetical protein [Aneurinibacillus migulanus]GED17282.1 hypothetical protein AMI01nite_52730 [Aneurinibacillus migulanus]SDJ34239.1 hypothetical protein SAMN04487909_11610 [Aneurinibacillus migulanus]